MKNTLVWQIVGSLTVSEMREVKLMLESPFFNKREDLRKLFDCLQKAKRTGKGVLSKEAVFRETQPEGAFDDQQLRLLLSYLFKIMEQYLVLKEMRDNSLGSHHLLLAAYRKRGLGAHFQKVLNRGGKQLERQPFRHAELFLEKYKIEHERYLFLSGSGRTKELNLQEVEDNLTAAMLGMKLRQACFLRSHEAVFNAHYDIALMGEILAEAARPKFRECPAVSLYLACYRALFQQQEGRYFKDFKKRLFENVGRFPKAEMRDLYLLAINFCIKKVNESDADYYREALDLYKSGLQTGLLIEGGRLSRFTYNNIVKIALLLREEWTWAGRFVEEYKAYLDPAFRESAFSLNSALMAYAGKHYDEALGHLQKADYKDLISNMVAKTLQLKIYFETDEYDLLDSHLRTMRMFIRRNKKMGYHRKNWSNIVRYTKKLMELNPFDEAQKTHLRKQIEAEEVLTEKEWLVERIESLRNQSLRG
ncbi:MAG TPA: hypothetical protein ENJ95_09975 [Bacteroidetes bacterium]|nr:hypothetical protein [Bacteroidota bacterium]